MNGTFSIYSEDSSTSPVFVVTVGKTENGDPWSNIESDLINSDHKVRLDIEYDKQRKVVINYGDISILKMTTDEGQV